MRALLLLAFVWLVGVATAGTICLTCNDLNYDCVPPNYVYDGCTIDPTSCPFPSCTTHCQGLYGTSATGSCSTSLFTCVCDTTAPAVPDVAAASPVAATAPVTKSTSTGGNGVSGATVSVATLDFASVRLGTDGTITTGVGFTVAIVLVAAVCVMVIIAIGAYVYPNWVKGGKKNGVEMMVVGSPFTKFIH